jgi:hypothetical protein
LDLSLERRAIVSFCGGEAQGRELETVDQLQLVRTMPTFRPIPGW